MGMGKGDAPDVPDYTKIAQQQSQANLDLAKYATQANRPTQITPWGTSSWTNGRTFDQAGYDQAMQQYQQAAANYQPGHIIGYQTVYNGTGSDGDTGKSVPVYSNGGGGSAPVAPNKNDYWAGGNDWTQTITLSPQMQALLDQQMNLQQGLFGAQNSALDRVNANMGQGFDTSGLPAAGTALDINSLPSAGSVYDPTLNTNNATDLIMQRINPQLEQQRESLRAQLANQGITQGSAAYANAMNQFGRDRNDAQNQAALAGINLGMQQQGLQFNQQDELRRLAAALQGQNFNQSQQARGQALQEQAYLRELPLNELNALRSGNSVSMPQFPGFSQMPQTAGPDLLNAANATYQGQLGNYNADQAAGAGMLGGLFGIGTTLLGAPNTSVFGTLLGR